MIIELRNNLIKNNPLLLDGEIAYEIDKDLFKIGDGKKNYNSLGYDTPSDQLKNVAHFLYESKKILIPAKDGINGRDGKNGIDGKDGINGKDGKDGKDGVDGKDGRDGKNGKDGKDGTDGYNGLNGEDGKDGINGKDGTNGIDGIDGKDGENGKDGKDGRDGVDGKDGSNWLIGREDPNAAFGKNGDMYLNLFNMNYYQKQSGKWMLLASFSCKTCINYGGGSSTNNISGVISVNGLSGVVPLTGTASRITISAANVFDIGIDVVTLAGIQALTNKTGLISQWTNDVGYITTTGITPSALTKVDDTNVTLTLGGSPLTSLLAATSLTLGWTGKLALSRFAQGTNGTILQGITASDSIYTGSPNLTTSLTIGATAVLSTEKLSIQNNDNSITYGVVSNTTSGTDGQAAFQTLTNAGLGLSMRALSPAFTTSGINVASTSVLSSNQLAGLNIGTSAATQLSFWTNNSIRMTISSVGVITIGSTIYPLTITSGYVPYATSANTIGSSSSLTFSGTNLGIGLAGNASVYTVDVRSTSYTNSSVWGYGTGAATIGANFVQASDDIAFTNLSYGFLAAYGRTTTGTIFGINRAGMVGFLAAPYATGYVQGTTNAFPLIFGTNDVRRASINVAGGFIIESGNKLWMKNTVSNTNYWSAVLVSGVLTWTDSGSTTLPTT